MSQSQSQIEFSCLTCGNTKLIEDNEGFYVCTVCGTQSQQILNEEIEDENLPEVGIKLYRINTSNKKIYTDEELLNRKYNILFNIFSDVLIIMCDKIIKLGYTNKVRIVVGRLWMKLLEFITSKLEKNYSLKIFNSRIVQIVESRYKKSKLPANYKQAQKESLNIFSQFDEESDDDQDGHNSDASQNDIELLTQTNTQTVCSLIFVLFVRLRIRGQLKKQNAKLLKRIVSTFNLHPP